MEVVQRICPKESVKIVMQVEEDYDWEQSEREKELAAKEQEKAAELAKAQQRAGSASRDEAGTSAEAGGT